MNTLILRPDQFLPDDCAALDLRQQRHLAEILKVKQGDNIRVGKLNGLLGSAIVCVNDSELSLREITLDTAPPQTLDVHLILALPRPQMMKRIFQTIATFGVKHCSLIHSQRVEKSFWQSPVLNENTIHEHLLLGLEQANATQMPGISMHKRFKPFIEDEYPASPQTTHSFILEPGDHSFISKPERTSVTLAIGPEGGFSDYEVQCFTNAGFAKRQLGERIFRVETAVTASLARLL